MIRKREVLKTLIIIPEVFIRNSYMFLSSKKTEMPIAEYYLQKLFHGSPDRKKNDVMMNMTSLFEIVIFCFLFGRYIYSEINREGLYVISRQKKRSIWCRGKLVELLLLSILYNFMYLFEVFIGAARKSQHSIGRIELVVFLETYVIFVLFSFLLVTIINMLSLKMGSNVAFMSVYLFMGIMLGIAVGHEKIFLLKDMPFLIKINPVANAFVIWEYNSMSDYYSIIYYFVLTVAVIIFSIFYVKRIDLSLYNEEEVG